MTTESNHQTRNYTEINTQDLTKNLMIIKRLSNEILFQNPSLSEPELQKTVQQLITLKALEHLLTIAKELAQQQSNEEKNPTTIMTLEKILNLAKDLTIQKISQNEVIEKIQRTIHTKEKKNKLTSLQKTTEKKKTAKPVVNPAQLLLEF
ncbi:MAG: hypothetical protein NZ529_02915 [Cytophagaceae bacterium]|nr:hypothetical protein [Cytophagaceae bacterium]MDW8455723.1 hypothetical protein [Cytophagaceae bacterium]